MAEFAPAVRHAQTVCAPLNTTIGFCAPSHSSAIAMISLTKINKVYWTTGIGRGLCPLLVTSLLKLFLYLVTELTPH
jgi:hypothetical protein